MCLERVKYRIPGNDIPGGIVVHVHPACILTSKRNASSNVLHNLVNKCCVCEKQGSFNLTLLHTKYLVKAPILLKVHHGDGSHIFGMPPAPKVLMFLLLNFV